MLEVRAFFVQIMKRCMEIEDIDKRVNMIQQLNKVLPSKYKFQIPSFITNDWIDKRLYALEEIISTSHT
jgi:hypothetical protein